MNTLVRGAGSIGSRHIKNAIALGHEVYATDPNPEAMAAALKLGARPLGPRATWDAVIDATPASERSACYGPTLIEKPLAIDAATVRHVAKYANPSSMVGFNLRFHDPLERFRQKIKSQPVIFARMWFSSDLREWRPGRDYRNTPSAQKALGGGILNEAQHELDLIRWLFGEWSWAQGWTMTSGRLPGIDVEDVGIALIGLADGGLVELHLDMICPGYRRGLEVTTLSGDYKMDLFWDGERERNQMYLDELAAFLKSVETGALDPRAATLSDGLAAVALADVIKRSAKTGERMFNGIDVMAEGWPPGMERLYR